MKIRKTRKEPKVSAKIGSRTKLPTLEKNLKNLNKNSSVKRLNKKTQKGDKIVLNFEVGYSEAGKRAIEDRGLKTTGRRNYTKIIEYNPNEDFGEQVFEKFAEMKEEYIKKYEAFFRLNEITIRWTE